ncbi:hypothetical protein SCUCBS95973_001643 [Sporothrix curviconia]|uniref:Uncharacterized protein n=1 Tax=Sporothrix curviconia TaxID=1260050 RepID=A0ABP0B0Y5_9PEZI
MRSFTSLLAASGLVQLASAAACKPHFCRNAILSSDPNLSDCSAFLVTTVILPVSTVYSTPSAVVTHTHTRVISETETDSVTSDFQPSLAIWSTYTSVDTINSVTLTTTKLITTTTSPKITKTTTTALATTTTTTTTMTTTKNGHQKLKMRVEDAPEAQTITNSEIPAYASACSYANIYASNCLALGVSATTTTLTPVESLTLSSTLVSTASADSSIYVSTTITETSTKTLPSLHSTTTVESTTIDVTSTETSTLYTKTATHTSFGIKVSTLATTTTTTTLATASPTPYTCKVSSSGSESKKYLDLVSVSSSSSFPGSYGVSFASSSSSAGKFVSTPLGLAVIYKTGSGSNTVNTPYYLVISPSGGYIVPTASPSSSDTILSCTIKTTGTPSFTSCTASLYAKTLSGVTYLTTSGSGALSFTLSATSY